MTVGTLLIRANLTVLVLRNNFILTVFTLSIGTLPIGLFLPFLIGLFDRLESFDQSEFHGLGPLYPSYFDRLDLLIGNNGTDLTVFHLVFLTV